MTRVKYHIITTPLTINKAVMGQRTPKTTCALQIAVMGKQTLKNHAIVIVSCVNAQPKIIRKTSAKRSLLENVMV